MILKSLWIIKLVLAIAAGGQITMSIPKLCCEYTKNKHGFITGCGMRAAFNKHWHYCPYCGKPIARLINTKENENT